MHAMLASDMHSRASHTAKSTGDKNPLAGRGLYSPLDELTTGGCDKGKSSSALEGQGTGNGRKQVGADDGELRIGSVGEGHNAHAIGKATDVMPGCHDFTG